MEDYLSERKYFDVLSNAEYTIFETMLETALFVLGKLDIIEDDVDIDSIRTTTYQDIERELRALYGPYESGISSNMALTPEVIASLYENMKRMPSSVKKAKDLIANLNDIRDVKELENVIKDKLSSMESAKP